jgi:hypothetical protein
VNKQTVFRGTPTYVVVYQVGACTKTMTVPYPQNKYCHNVFTVPKPNPILYLATTHDIIICGTVNKSHLYPLLNDPQNASNFAPAASFLRAQQSSIITAQVAQELALYHSL